MLLLSFWVSLGNSRLELCPWGCSLCPSGSGVPLRLMPHEMLLIWLTPIPTSSSSSELHCTLQRCRLILPNG